MDPGKLRSVLRNLREKRGLTLQEVATSMGYTRAAISAIETRQKHFPLETIAALAAIYGVKTFEIVRIAESGEICKTCCGCGYVYSESQLCPSPTHSRTMSD